MKLRPLFALATLSLLPLASPANAQEAPPPAVRAPGPEPLEDGSATPSPTKADEVRVWYGWQTLVSDGSTVLSTMALARMNNQDFTVGAVNLLAGYALGGPAIHLVHGRPVTALADLGLRVGAFFLGGLIGQAGCGSSPSSYDKSSSQQFGICQTVSVLAGAGLGALGAIIVDATALSTETKPVAPAVSTVGRSFTLEPTLLLAKEQTGLGILGTF